MLSLRRIKTSRGILEEVVPRLIRAIKGADVTALELSFFGTRRLCVIPSVSLAIVTQIDHVRRCTNVEIHARMST